MMQVRKTVVEWLDSKGLLRGTQDNEMSVPFCSRSKDIIEPVLKPQWWVNCQGMAQDGIKAAQDGSLEIIPSDFEATWYRYCVTSDILYFYCHHAFLSINLHCEVGFAPKILMFLNPRAMSLDAYTGLSSWVCLFKSVSDRVVLWSSHQKW